MAPNSRTNGDQGRPLCFAIGPYGDKGTQRASGRTFFSPRSSSRS